MLNSFSLLGDNAEGVGKKLLNIFRKTNSHISHECGDLQEAFLGENFNFALFMCTDDDDVYSTSI